MVGIIVQLHIQNLFKLPCSDSVYASIFDIRILCYNVGDS